MSIADKLQIIAENEQKVFNEGYEKGKQDATKEEQEKTVTITENGTTEILPDTDKAFSKVTVNVDVEQGVFPSGEITITENGVYDVTNYESANVEIKGTSESTDLFPYAENVVFSVDIKEVKEDIVLHLERANTLANLFDLKPLCCEKVTIYISNLCKNMGRAFGRASIGNKVKEIVIVGDTSNITSFNQTFQQQHLLERIVGNFDFSSAISSTAISHTFNSCSALQEIYPVANTIKVSISFSSSPNLIPESIQSIIDGLADLTSGTVQTLTFHADVKAKLTEQQIFSITNKNWTLA